MNKIKIICDSSCDLDFNYAKSIGIDIEPLMITFDTEHTYRDGVDIDVDQLYKNVELFKTTPKTSAKTPKEYFMLFEKYVAEGYDIIYTGIGGGFSSSYSTGTMIAKQVEGNIEVVDSMNLSTGIALILFKALKWIEEGNDVHQVANKMRIEATKIRSQFAIDTLDYLYKGGRCSGMAKIFGTILKIKPVILVRDNQMVVGAKVRGKLNFAIDEMIKLLKEDQEKFGVDPEMITITHSKAPEYVEYAKEKILEIIPNANIMVTNAGCIVSSHCGPNTLGIFYSLK